MALSSSDRGVVVVFAKAPRAGMVKTRMSPPLSPDQAALLYSHLLDDVLEATGAFAKALELDAVVAVHPVEACREFVSRVPANYRVIAQHGNGLAERMAYAVGEAAASGATRILLRGSDNPVLGRDRFQSTLDRLSSSDVVVSPDLDGGYGLIGLRDSVSGLFDHPMSTGSVLDETLANARERGLRCSVLDPSFDLDTVADFAELERARNAGEAELCPRTIAYLDACELWRFGCEQPPSEPRSRS